MLKTASRREGRQTCCNGSEGGQEELKHTEKNVKARQSTRQEVAVYHFTKVTNVALLLFPLSVAMALLPTEATVCFEGMSF